MKGRPKHKESPDAFGIALSLEKNYTKPPFKSENIPLLQLMKMIYLSPKDLNAMYPVGARLVLRDK